jgi:hypothetical protein
MNNQIEEKHEDRILKYLPLCGSVIIFAGVIRLMQYYYVFNVNIISFLDFGEILTSFFDLLVIIIGLVLLALVRAYVLTSELEDKIEERKHELITSEPSFRRRVRLHIKHHPGNYILFILCGVAFVIIDIFFRKVPFHIYIGFLGGLFVLLTLRIVLIELNVKQKRTQALKEEVEISYALLFAGLFIIIVVFFSYGQAVITMEFKTNNGITFEIDKDSVVVSDSSNYYIGNTRNYLFYYHENTEKTDIIPMSRITKLTFVPPYRH